MDEFNVEQVRWFDEINAACNEGDAERVAELLKSSQADVNLCDDFTHRSPLHSACMNNRVEVVKMLLAAGAKNSIEGRGGLDPIQHAIREGFHQVVRACLASGVDPNFRPDPREGSPMSKAAIEGDEDMVDLLVEYGGIIERWMIDMARDCRGNEWASFLEQHLALREKEALIDDEDILPGTESPRVRKGL